jgi:hypothetical protein
MDKERFHQLTKDLVRYSVRLERDVLAPAKPMDCAHCPRKVTDQLITCEPHKLGTEQQHFKHKCYVCRQTVYDGSYVKEPRQLRPFNNYTPTTKLLSGTPAGPRLTKNGKVSGRPRKVRPPVEKRAPGRPRKAAQS